MNLNRILFFLKKFYNNYLIRKKVKAKELQNKLYYASQRTLIWHSFKKHKLAHFSLYILILFYILTTFSDFFVPYDSQFRLKDFNEIKPTSIYFINEKGNFSRPFIYGVKKELDIDTFKYKLIEDKSKMYAIKLFIKTKPYDLYGITLQHKLFGIEDNKIPFYLLGSDRIGRDIFSRIFHAGKISLYIGFGGVIVTFLVGIIMGGISGFYGGKIDEVIQRIIEVLISIPEIPIWIALSAALPREWGTIKIYFAITLILAVRGWTGLARVVRGKIISLREEEFALAAKASGASNSRIIFRHLLPAFISYLIVHITLAIPNMILGETALSFLGLGIRPPAVSWGTLLQDAQEITVIANYPWLLTPAIFVVIAILVFNFIGDGIRDAADPYSTK